MKLINWILSSILFFTLSFTAQAADFDSLKILQGLNRQQEELNRSFRALGFGDISSESKGSTHTKFIDVPHELKQRAFFHISCDCKNLVQNDHYCGSHALVHGLDIEQTHGLTTAKSNPETEVMALFDKFNFKSDESRKLTINIKKIADALGFDSIYLDLKDGQLKATFDKSEATALKKLTEMRLDLLTAHNKTVIKHIFARHMAADQLGVMVPHVALFSVIADEQGITITLHDNLNRPLVKGSALFVYADQLIRFFIEADKAEIAYELLLTTLANPSDRRRRLVQIKDSTIFYRNSVVEYLFDEWLKGATNEVKALKPLDIKSFNAPLKALKLLASFEKNSVARALILKAYEAMIASVQNHETATKEEKSTQAERILKALNLTVNIQQLFSLEKDQAAKDLYDKAKNYADCLKRI